MTLAPNDISLGDRSRPTAGENISVDEGYCINLRGRQDACDLCQRVCHAVAVSLRLDEVSVDPTRCVGCGACVPACPSGVFSLGGFDPEAFISRIPAEPEVTIGCVQSDIGALAVACHKMLDARILAALLAEGVDRVRLAGTESCRDCPSGDARPEIGRTVRTLVSWFGDHAPEIVTAREAGGPAGNGRAGERRRLLRGAFASLSRSGPSGFVDEASAPCAAPAFDSLLEADDAGTEAEARPVPYQQVLATRRQRLPFRDDGPVGATGRAIDDNCSGCLVCADLCPTGALESESDASRRLVSFDPARCTNCTLCLKACPMGTISAHAIRGVDAATRGRTVLFLRRMATCTDCGGTFEPESGTDGSTCPQCRNERDMDEDWTEMLSG